MVRQTQYTGTLTGKRDTAYWHSYWYERQHTGTLTGNTGMT